jgi:hypothetical protein
MTNQKTINELFNTLRNGTDQEKAEMREFIRRRENQYLLHDPAFVRAAVANADLFGIVGDDEDEFENDDVCPCCGQPVMQEE